MLIDVLICLLAFPLVVDGQGKSAVCDRRQSRQARDIIQRKVILEASSAGYQLPSDCPWAPERDMLKQQEDFKEKITQREWNCKQCGKTFTSEDWLDAHLDRKHMQDIPATRDICLADYCDILQCADSSEKAMPLGLNTYDYKDPLNAMLKPACDPADMQKKQYLCQGLVQKCANPDHGSVHHRVYDIVTKSLCASLTCDPKKADSDESTDDSVLYYVLFSFLVVILLLYYAGLYVYH
eukprot:g494.t1